MISVKLFVLEIVGLFLFERSLGLIYVIVWSDILTLFSSIFNDPFDRNSPVSCLLKG